MKCHICNKELHYLFETKYIDENPTCSDCYYEELGKVIEKYPIGFCFYKQNDEPDQ